jgi:very-short-patch-repair endonuclease
MAELTGQADDQGTGVELRQRAVRLFEYLHAVRALREQPVRQLDSYADRCWWRADIPDHPAVRVATDTEEGWMVVGKASLPAPPPVPHDLIGLLDRERADDPTREPRLASNVDDRVGDEQEATAQANQVLETWLRAEWRPWATRARPALQARRLYEELYDLRLRLQREEAVTELVWGHGVIGWRVDGEQVLHPLITSRMLLRFDPNSGEIAVVPEGEGQLNLEIEILQGLNITGFDLLVDQRQRFRAAPVDPWGPEIRSLYERLLHPLGLDSRLVEEERPAPPAAAPTITNTWTLFVRRRSTLYQRFFQGLVEALRNPEATVPAPLAAVLADEPSTLNVAGGEEEWRRIGERLLMPLPANAEQEDIAKRLARHRGVTVQGPPGTGKTHTIANLVSHLVAHGKRVLVASHKEQPLAVLREKIPEPIRDLCVSVLGASGAALSQLERSVQAIHERAADLDHAAARLEIARAEDELDLAQREVARLRSRILRTVEREWEPYPLGDREFLPSELARWVKANSDRLSFIPDALAHDTEPPLDTGDLAALYRLARSVAGDDRDAAMRSRPPVERLPTGEDLRLWFERLTELRAGLAPTEGWVEGWSSIEAIGPEELAKLASAVEASVARLETLSEPWLIRLRDGVSQSVEEYGWWRDQCKLLREAIDNIARYRSLLAGHVVSLPKSGLPSKETVVGLHELRDRLAAGKPVSRIFQRDLAALQSACEVDGELPRTAEDVELLLVLARLGRLRYELVNRWNDAVGRIGGTLLDRASMHPESEIVGHLGRMEAALAWENGEWDGLRERLQAAAIRSPERPDVHALRDLVTILRIAQTRFDERDRTRRLNDLWAYLRAGEGTTDASPLWHQLRSALRDHNLAAWDDARAEATRLAGIQGEVEALETLASRLSLAAPRWAALIVETGGDEQRCGDPSLAGQAWSWRQAETWLTELLRGDDPTELQRRLEAGLQRVAELTTRLAAASAWLAVGERLTDAQRRSLTKWAQALQKVGKGTGKYAPRWRAEAQQAMQQARGAVPVWVMPAYRVVESFDPADEPFDVVILDESSQCDVFALALLGIARKAIVVGDDKQISPQAVGVDQEAVHQLIAQHLRGIPDAAMLDVTSSLYDVAKRTFPGVIMLKEHFRCLPEIIQFSNDLAYGGEILPLREETADESWRPVVDVLVPDGYREAGSDVNPPEADRIVDQIATMCQDPRYEGKTIGVISLLGEAQAQRIETQLIARLGEREIERRRLRCGNAYHFQGDERDVMFLSLVVAGGDQRIGAMNKQADRQRVNVAASRARDQLWCVHSVTAEQLHPEDVRARLIRYCRNPYKAAAQYGDLADKCDSDFERDVLRQLLSRGFAVQVQHRVGRFRIDLVVRGRRSRLAVECDGDAFHPPEQWEADRRRQEILERLGWKFFRVRGSAFYRDRDAALVPLWDRLETMGIRPGDHDQPATSWLEAADALHPSGEPDSPISPSGIRGQDSPSVAGPQLAHPVEQEVEVTEPYERSTPARRSAQAEATMPDLGLKALVTWSPRPMPDIHVAPTAKVAEAMIEIVRAEGPILASRAYELYVRANGGQRVGRALRYGLSQATGVAVRRGWLAELPGVQPGRENRTLYLPGTAQVVPRVRGDRDLEQIPVSEVAEVIRRIWQRDPTLAGETLKRTLLAVYDRARLTAGASLFLDRCMREAETNRHDQGEA